VGQARSIRALLAEDEPKLAFAVSVLLDLEERIELIATAKDGRAAVELALELRPDVIILDIRLNGLDGLRAGQEILAEWPQARIVVYSGDEDALRDARKCGFDAALLKGNLAADLVTAIEQAAGAIR
jgi:two-component system, NarL family, response regulator LiaR